MGTVLGYDQLVAFGAHTGVLATVGGFSPYIAAMVSRT